MSSTFIKSEQGTKAAWKGFSSQTTYIAYRLMLLDDDSEFYPERIEDLMLQKGNIKTELVQVKNLASDLSLSDLSPKDSDSFFRRSLSLRDNNSNLVLRIVSFGNIGAELKGLIEDDESSKESIKSKLKGYGYKDDEIEWLLYQIVIQKVEENDLLTKLYEKLETLIESMAAPSVVLDILTNYVSRLSRNGGYTSRAMLIEELQKIGLDLAAMSGMARQYGNSIIPIYEYKSDASAIDLKSEYMSGVNALPQHIRANLDIHRSYWLNKIETAFDTQNIVVIKGASGQGKSSLAYRYLINNYAENEIICIEKVTSETQALDIRSSLSGIAKSRNIPIIAYMDVSPYDTNWLWLCEKVHSQGIDIPLLVTIRAEDFQRSSVDYSKHFFEEINLTFGKDEAAELFQHYSSHDFLSFDDAWASFGESGPLLEFTYMLNQSEKLKNRLASQISRITQNESDADDWLRALTVICYAGKNNLVIDIVKLFSFISCSQQRKMLETFEKEYFIRTVSGGKYIECLHALRATILYEILKDEAFYPELNVLVTALKSIAGNALMMVVDYVYRSGISENLVDSLAALPYDSWLLYAGVVKALIWAEVYAFYLHNKAIIDEGDILTNGSFPMLCIGDITGYLGELDMDGFWNTIEQTQPGIKGKLQVVLEKMPLKIITYRFLDRFLQKTIDSLPLSNSLGQDELTPAGYALFWTAKRRVSLPEEKCKLRVTDCENPNWLDDYLNFLVGVQEQNWLTVHEALYEYTKNQIQKKYDLLLLEESEDEISAISITNIFDENYESQSNNNHIMSIVNAIRRRYPQKKKYNVEMIGHEIVEGITVPDMQKHILADKLPWVWITQINGWMLNLNEFDHRPPTWSVCLNNIFQLRSNIINIAKHMINGLDLLYKKRNPQNFTTIEFKRLLRKTIAQANDMYAYYPQSEMDKYGLVLDNRINQYIGNDFNMQIKGKENSTFDKSFREYKFSILNFINQKDALLLNKMKNEPVSNIGRLSLINLISAVEQLPQMQKAYYQEFFLKNMPFDDNEEYSQLLLLASIWNYLYQNPFRIEESVSYKQKEYIKAYRRKIERFFYEVVKQYDGIISLGKSGQVIELVIDSDNFDNVCAQMFIDMKRQFSEASTLTLEGFLWKEHFSELHIKMQFWGSLFPGSMIIPSNHFIIYDDVETFLKFRTQNEVSNVALEDSAKYIVIKCFAYKQPLHTLARHISQVNTIAVSYHITKSNCTIYSMWTDKAEQLICKVLDDIIINLQCLYEKVDSDEATSSSIHSSFIVAMEAIQEMRKKAAAYVSSITMDSIVSQYDGLSASMAAFIGTIPQELFL